MATNEEQSVDLVEDQSVEPQPKRTRSRASVLCPHCDQYISKSTYYRHRAAFYDRRGNQWSKSLKSSTESGSSDDGNTEETSSSESVQSNPPEDYGSDIDIGHSSSTRMLGDEDKLFFSSSDDDAVDSDKLPDDQTTHDLEEMWFSSSDESDTADTQPSSRSNLQPVPVYYFILLLLFWKAAFRISASSITVLLRLIKYFLKLLGTAYNCVQIVDISHQIPVTLTSIERIARLENRSFIEYVVCPGCSVIYEFQDCVRILPNGKKESKTCRHVAYPNHPHPSKRKACGALLLKKQTNSKKSVLAPIKIYPYRSVKKSICHILKKPGFVEKCEQWRKRMTVMPDDILSDVYDGKIWKEFTSSDFNHFLDVPYSYLVTLNVDWFQLQTDYLFDWCYLLNDSKFTP